MASFKVEGLFDFDDLLNAGAVPGDTMNKMLHAAADVAVKAQKRTAKQMLNGRYATGALSESIKKGRISTTKDGKAIKIVFDGTRRRGSSTASNAEIAFVNEFGKRGQDPRPFIKTANEQCEAEAIEAAAKVYDKWIDSQGF